MLLVDPQHRITGPLITLVHQIRPDADQREVVTQPLQAGLDVGGCRTDIPISFLDHPAQDGLIKQLVQGIQGEFGDARYLITQELFTSQDEVLSASAIDTIIAAVIDIRVQGRLQIIYCVGEPIQWFSQGVGQHCLIRGQVHDSLLNLAVGKPVEHVDVGFLVGPRRAACTSLWVAPAGGVRVVTSKL